MAERRVLHIITGLNPGGAETALYRLLESLRHWPGRHAVIGLLPHGEIGDRLAKLGLPVMALGWRRGLPSPGSFTKLIREARAFAPHVIHGWMYHGNLAARSILPFVPGHPELMFNVRHTIRALADEKPLTRHVIGLGARVSSRAAAIVYNAHASARRHEEVGYCAARTIVIPNGFDLAVFKPDEQSRLGVREEFGVELDAPLVGFIGRDHVDKGPDLFAAAASLVNAERRDCRFVMLGQGLEPGLPSWLEAVSPPSTLEFLGPRTDVSRILAGLDVLVSTSRTEAFANVIGEAMACGTSVVASDVGDSRRIISGYGAVVPPGDPVAFAQAILSTLNTPPEKRRELGALARDHVGSNFAIDQVAGRYASLYRLVNSPFGCGASATRFS